MATSDSIAAAPHSAFAATAARATPGPGSAFSSGRPRQYLVLIGFVAVLSLLLSTFPVRNSDYWWHLAAGRYIVRDHTLPEPAFLALSGSSVHHSWLYDATTYLLYSAAGDMGMGVFKSLVLVIIALVLLRASYSQRGLWLATACTALALIAMSTRFPLQPVIWSYLFLALTVWLLHRHAEARNAVPSFLPWPLLPLFAVWANVDSWFVLGLAVAGMTMLGHWLDTWRQAKGTRGARLVGVMFGWTLLIVVCLLNPSHVRIYEVPRDLQGLFTMSSAENSDISRHVLSPFQGAYFSTIGATPAGLAYFPLIGLGLLAFFACPAWKWARFLPWLGLGVISAIEARTIPFFAIVAGPALAWNVVDRLARRFDPERNPIPPHVLAAVRVPAAMIGVIILACAWPGWLQAPPFEPRRWGVEMAPSLQRGALAAQRWHAAGKLQARDRGLHLTAETSHAFAWFCPEDRAVLDEGLAAVVRNEKEAPPDWRDRFQSAAINHLVIYDTDRRRLVTALERALANPAECPLLHLEGDLAIVGWCDPRDRAASKQFSSWALDSGQLAFRPEPEKRAPRHPPNAEPDKRPWWEAYWKRSPPPPLDRGEAALHLLHAQVLRRFAPYGHMSAWELSQSAGLVGALGSAPVPAGVMTDLYLRLVRIEPQTPAAGAGLESLPPLDRLAHSLQQGFTLSRDDTPPELLFLAIRAARRALAVNPLDAQANLVLAESYLTLLHSTRERTWSARMPELVQLRRAQATAALHRALALQPDLVQAHLSLGRLYRDMGYLDLSLKHLRAYLHLARAAGRPRDVTAEAFREHEAYWDREISQFAKEVDERLRAYSAEAGGLRVLDRAMLAQSKGLVGKALEVLLESDIAAFGPQGMALELELLLRTGRARDVRDWTDPEHAADLNPSRYHWLRVQALAATGNYGLAQEECESLIQSISLTEQGKRPAQFREVMAALVARAVLDGAGGPAAESIRPWQTLFRWMDVQNRIANLARVVRETTDVVVLAGLLALEEGDVDEADVAFRLALDVWGDEAQSLGSRIDFTSRPIAEGYEKLLKKASEAP